MVKRVGKYEIGNTLGQGTFGKVKLATNTETGQQVAIKILDKEKIQKQNMGAQIKKEISIMKMVKHAHVVQLYEVLASRSKIFIVLELITGGELFDKIVREGRFNEEMARFYFRQLVRGVKYCHTMGVCHRDLKPENLLLDEHGNLKISDFGLSALYTGSTEDNSRATLLHTTCGTPNYVAPEVLNDKGYDGRAADVWSMGVILYVLLAGFLPFDEPIMSSLFRKIQKAEFDYPKWFTPEVRALLDKILVADPKRRINLAQIERDPWMSKGAVSKDGGGEGKEGGVLVPNPSQQDMDSAMADVTHEESKDADGMRKLNAFDIVSMFGGLSLNHILMSASTTTHFHRPPQFFSSSPASEIIERVNKHLTTMGCSPEVNAPAFRVSGHKLTPKGEISISVSIASLSEACRVVGVERGRGDRLEFSKLYDELLTHCADLVLDVSPASSHK